MEEKNNLNELKNNKIINWDLVDNKIKTFSLEGEIKKGKCVNVYDGDTIKVVFPIHDKLYRWNCRLSGVDTPELRTKNKEEKKMGYKVRDKLREKILNKMIYVKCGEFDKYGRLLAEIYLENEYQVGGSSMETNTSINKWLINNKYAFKYDGGKKKGWYFL